MFSVKKNQKEQFRCLLVSSFPFLTTLFNGMTISLTSCEKLDDDNQTLISPISQFKL